MARPHVGKFKLPRVRRITPEYLSVLESAVRSHGVHEGENGSFFVAWDDDEGHTLADSFTDADIRGRIRSGTVFAKDRESGDSIVASVDVTMWPAIVSRVEAQSHDKAAALGWAHAVRLTITQWTKGHRSTRVILGRLGALAREPLVVAVVAAMVGVIVGKAL